MTTTLTATISHTHPDTPRSAAELLTAVAAGDPHAWQQVMARYANMVAARVRSFDSKTPTPATRCI